MNEKIEKLFLDNLDLDQEFAALCNHTPKLQKAKEECYHLLSQVEHAMGFDFTDALEEKILCYSICLSEAYYMFGLGLRQDILNALLKK